MIYGSVCSGIEAASVAWHPLGWRASFLSEIEPFPRAVLAHHYPEVPLHGDFTTIQKGMYAAIDLLVGGTPCQSFSVAGLRKGLDDPRGNLMLEFGALARRLRPVWLVWENVPGVLSSNGGRDFGSFLGMLGELGYGFAYRVLDAQFFGVAQRRRRVFVVGYLGDWHSAAAVLFERYSLSGNPAPSREKGKDIAPTIRAGAANGGAGHGARSGDSKDELIVPVAQTLRAQAQASHRADTETYIPCLSRCDTAGEAKRQDYETCTIIAETAHTLRGEGFDASEDGTGRGTPLIPCIAFPERMSGTQCASAENLAPSMGALNPSAIAYTTKLHNTSSNNAGKIFEERTVGLDANSPPPALLTATQVRRLTPRECERLQGFPDDYTLIPVKRVRRERLLSPRAGYDYREINGEVWQLAADGPRYKALGNSMAVPVMHWIGQRIQQVGAIIAPVEAAA